MILTALREQREIEDKDDNNDDEEARFINMNSSICIYRNDKNMCVYGE